MKSKYILAINTSLVLLFLVYLSQPALSSVFWEVKSQNATVYLLGSVHLANESFYPLDTAIENSFERSDYLVTEINLDDIDIGSLSESMYYPKGDSLPLHIADTTFSKVIQYFADKGVSRKMIRKMKPSIIVMTMMNIEYMKSGLSPTYGLDFYFTKKVGKKPILQLETASTQLEVLGKMDEDTDLFINSTIDALPGIAGQIDTMLTAWKTGDLELLERNVIEQLKSETDTEKDFSYEILDARNFKMYDKIKEYLTSDSTYFIVVGAAHLLGETGIIQLLEKDSFTPIRR